MSKFQRVKSVLIGILMILFAVSLLTTPEYSYYIIAFVVSALVFLYGFKLLVYYFTMARYMVGGKSILCQAIIILDLALFTTTMVYMSDVMIIVYLLGIYAVAGFVDILRAFEARKFRASGWKLKLVTGIIGVLFALTLVIVGAVIGNLRLIVYGYCFSLCYSAVVRIVTAFRRTAIVFIQ